VAGKQSQRSTNLTVWWNNRRISKEDYEAALERLEGEAEVDVVKIADSTIVVLVPGLGDSIQTIKSRYYGNS
jgi:hypothetical protein